MPLRSESSAHTRHWSHRTRQGELRRRRHISAHRATRFRAKTREARQRWSDHKARRAGTNVTNSYDEPGTTTPLDHLNELAFRRTRRNHRHRDHMKSYIRSKAHRTSHRADSVRKYTRSKITHTETMSTREYLRAKAHRAKVRAETMAARKRDRHAGDKEQGMVSSPTSLPSSPPPMNLDRPSRLATMPLPVRRNTFSDSEQDEMGESIRHQSRLHRHLRRRRTEDGGILR